MNGVLGTLIFIGLMAYLWTCVTRPSPEPAGPFKVRWRPLEAIGIVLAGYVLAQIVTAAVVSGVEGDSSLLTFLAGLVFSGTVVGVLGYIVWKRKGSLESIGLKRPTKLDPVYAFAGFGVYVLAFSAALFIVSQLFPNLNLNQPQQLGYEPGVTGLLLVLTFIGLVIIPPVSEEIVFRGFMYGGLRSRLKLWLAALITSVIFAVAHLQIGFGAPLVWAAAIDTFVLSLVLIGLRERTGSLTAPILLHGLKNLIAFTLLFAIGLN